MDSVGSSNIELQGFGAVRERSAAQAPVPMSTGARVEKFAQDTKAAKSGDVNKIADEFRSCLDQIQKDTDLEPKTKEEMIGKLKDAVVNYKKAIIKKEGPNSLIAKFIARLETKAVDTLSNMKTTENVNQQVEVKGMNAVQLATADAIRQKSISDMEIIPHKESIETIVEKHVTKHVEADIKNRNFSSIARINKNAEECYKRIINDTGLSVKDKFAALDGLNSALNKYQNHMTLQFRSFPEGMEKQEKAFENVRSDVYTTHINYDSFIREIPNIKSAITEHNDLIDKYDIVKNDPEKKFEARELKEKIADAADKISNSATKTKSPILIAVAGKAANQTIDEYNSKISRDAGPANFSKLPRLDQLFKNEETRIKEEIGSGTKNHGELVDQLLKTQYILRNVR